MTGVSNTDSAASPPSQTTTATRELERHGVHLCLGRLRSAGIANWLASRPITLLISDFDGNIADLRAIGEVPSIRFAGIVDSPGVDDGVFDYLVRLRDLRDLSLYGTRVTAAGVSRLQTLPKLHDVCVSHTRVRPEDLASLRATMPRVHFHLDNSEPYERPADFIRRIASDAEQCVAPKPPDGAF